MAAPAFDDDLRLGEAIEDLPVQQLVAELGIEALTVAVLPRRAGLDLGGLRVDGGGGDGGLEHPALVDVLAQRIDGQGPVAAPGGDMLVASARGPDWRASSGTSLAAPRGAGGSKSFPSCALGS